ncbi:MAG: hypothetical protein COV60_00360 [Candidatus Magasanikbacteria bacterium CG11_big_fil_rev_8_21_14_0_20_43_7]|uniref:PrgI family protein n=1 Tax=Candidatus Magasanikbacteria bacterium CG11_big_fil_rev_8_21_14_0_20_43_7 TaxID=1974654 RepID=A0A2H0N3H7_9BACT|nr:MAG: hypothetical protein COV60_00360 [Candidatus Magasanikbacteria bacterium CG11_big_fil_rev_8_21_14_0_20_43_7]
MQQFVVPQFIDVEDQIIGPITTRQFLILLVAGITIFIAYKYADLSLFIPVAAIVGSGAVVFSFVKVNGQPFHFFLLNIIQTLKKPSLRIWNKSYSKKELEYFRRQSAIEDVTEDTQKKTVRKKHITDLSLVVNTGGYYKPADFE